MADEGNGSGITVRRRKLSEYTTDPHNANRGTERGRGMLESSLRRFGAARSLVADRNGVLPAGNKTAEAAFDLGLTDVIEVETDGHELVVVKRRDWDIATDAAPREYAHFDNRVSQVDYDPDLDVLLEDLQRGDLNLSDLWRDDEIAALVAALVRPDADQWGAALGDLPDGDRTPFQQMTFTLHDEQAEIVKEAIERAKEQGPFLDGLNENSNGNALARICQFFASQAVA